MITADLALLIPPEAGGLQPSEIVPHPDEGEAWVELYNASDAALRLAACRTGR